MESKPAERSSYKRKVTSRERIFYRNPHANVAMVAKIKGNVSIKLLRSIVRVIPREHPLLSVRIVHDNNDDIWFTSEEVPELEVQMFPRTSDSLWYEKFQEECKIPFELANGPLIRFLLFHSPEISELLIFCQHIICDGMSLAYLMRDILTYLGEPKQNIEISLDPPVLNHENLPSAAQPNFLAKKLVAFSTWKYNHKWQQRKVFFDEEE